MFNAVRPTAPLLNMYCLVMNMIATVNSAPTKLPTKTMPQLRNIWAVVTLRAAQAITIRLLPVNSSAPATTTRIRPKQKTRPPRRRFTP